MDRQARSKTTSLSGDEIPRAFLRALVMLFGGYRTALKMKSGEVVFDKETFINSRPEAFRPFLKTALQLQVFQQFIDERLLLINSNQGFFDIFEQEVSCMEHKYKQKNIKKFEDLKLFTQKFIKMDASSFEISKEKNTVKSTIFSKQMFRTNQRKMSIQYPNGGTKEKTKKLLSVSNSSDRLDQHIKMTPSNKVIQEMPYEGERTEKNLAIRDELPWPDLASSSSSDNFCLASQENLDQYLDASNKFNHCFIEAVSIPSLTSTDPYGKKPSKQDNINVQRLIKMYEKNGKEKENSALDTSPYPGTYFPPGQTPSSIAERQAKLQTSTEEWKKKFRSRNIADVTMDISINIKKLSQDSEVEKPCTKPTLKSLQNTYNCQKESTNSSPIASAKTETVNCAEKNKSSPQILRGLSHSGLSRRSAFKVHHSQSSSESQRDSVLQMYKNSLKNSAEEIQQAYQKKILSSNDGFTTPPLSPSSSPPSTEEESAVPCDGLNALYIGDLGSSSQTMFKGSISPTSTVSSYSSFVSLEEDTSASNLTSNDFNKNIL